MSATSTHYHSDRTFQLWDYWVSHQRAALRAYGIDHEDSIDVLFHGVAAIATQTHVRGVALREGSEQDWDVIAPFLPDATRDSDRLFCLQTDGPPSLIVAVAWQVIVHRLSPGESGPWVDAMSDPHDWPGEVTLSSWDKSSR